MGKLKLKTIKKSHRSDKKWDAVFLRPDGTQKVQPFGQRGYSDFTKHKDATRKQRYIARHKRMHEDWKDPTRAGPLSRFILWNKPTMAASVRSYRRMFRV